jgi:formylglycine-generating enzyme required for sulfatase activity
MNIPPLFQTAVSAAIFCLWVISAAADEPRNILQDCPSCPKMIAVPAGEFLMGSPADEPYRGADEGPQHLVKIAEPFMVGIYEVTFDEWETCHVEGACTYLPGDVGWGRGQNPVIRVNWSDAQTYVQWLTQKTGESYRLPTEAEWEYFARAGTSTAYHTGDELLNSDANFDARTPENIIGIILREAVTVGQYAANGFGIYDIHGNVSEWVQECYDPNSYETLTTQPNSDQTTENCKRIARGGTSHYGHGFARSANRAPFSGDVRSLDVGFRVVRDIPLTKGK